VTGGVWVEVMQDFMIPEIKRRVSAETKYDLEINEQYGGTLAKLGECLEAIETGIMDFGLVINVFEMSKLPLQTHFWWIPFCSPNMQEVNKADHATHERCPQIDEEYQRYNQTLIGIGGVSSFHLVVNKPVHTLEDMEGLKIAHGGPMVPWAQGLGAVGVQSMLNEAYTCLDTGVYDGWFMEPNAVKGFKMYEPAPYYSLIDLGAGNTIHLSINNDVKANLPPEVLDIICDVATEWEQENIKVATGRVDGILEFFEGEGVEVYQLPDEEKVRWAKAVHEAQVVEPVVEPLDEKGLDATGVARTYVEELGKQGYEFPHLPDFLK